MHPLRQFYKGRLAQLVQSICLTSRGSAVRLRHRPQIFKRKEPKFLPFLIDVPLPGTSLIKKIGLLIKSVLVFIKKTLFRFSHHATKCRLVSVTLVTKKLLALTAGLVIIVNMLKILVKYCVTCETKLYIFAL